MERIDPVVGVPLRYVDHVSLAQVNNNRLIAPLPPNPYANIVVAAPGQASLILHVSHKLDFLNLWLLDQKQALSDLGLEDHDIVICHKPATGLKAVVRKFLPSLEYSMYPKGHFEKLCNPHQRVLAEDIKPLVRLHGHKRTVDPLLNLFDQQRFDDLARQIEI